LTYTIRIENTGGKSFSRSLVSAFRETDDGGRYYTYDVRPPTASPGTIDPGTRADMVFVWTIEKPGQIRLMRLGVNLAFEYYHPTARWILTP
jgi:hypothetical protein